MKKLGILLLGILVLAGCQQQEKTAYVNNKLLRKNFKALQNSNEKYKAKGQAVQSSLQPEIQKFQAKVQEFQEKVKNKSLSESEQDQQRQVLMKEQKQLRQKSQAKRSAIMQKEQNAQDSLMDIMQNTIATYAKAHHYVYVFGANDNGHNIQYADDSKNITQKILEKLNGGSTGSSKEEKNTVEKDTAAQ